MKSRSLFTSSLLALVLSACGGQEKQAAPAPSPGTPGPAAASSSSASATATAPRLGTPLRADQVADLERLRASRQQQDLARRGGAQSAGIAVDTTDREAVRNLYNGLFAGAPEAPMEWTGSYASGAAGTVSAAYQASSLLRINWFRAMAGLASVSLSAETSAKAQEAAMMMSVNKQLSHFPPTSWKNYTAIGADAAGHSSLAMSAGVSAMNSYVHDYGDNNSIVGHRRWLFYPQTREFGSGSVPGGSVNGVSAPAANALWVFDGNYNTARPAVRDEFVAWPPPGHVPYPVVYGRWSFSYPDADFTKAAVAVSKDGVRLGVTLEAVQNGYGENTLVWLLSNTTSGSVMARPETDQRYSVTLSNVMVAGIARTFSYDVTVIDPATPTAGTPLTTVNLPAQVDKGAGFVLQVTPMASATSYEIAGYQRRTLDGIVFDPANAAGNWTAQTSGTYDSLGAPRFQLRHADGQDQALHLNKQLLVGAKGSIAFKRSTGFATVEESFSVQLSRDNGSSWADVYTEAGTGQPSPETAVVVSMAKFAGSSVRLRLALKQNGRYYTCDTCGWNIANVALSGVDELLDAQAFAAPASAASVGAALAKPGDYVFFGRTQYQWRYFSDWGPAAMLHVDGALLSGKRSNYTITRSAAGLVIVDHVGGDGRQTVNNPFRLDFSDISIAYDTEGNAGKAYRLYQAALNRQPDREGMGFWIKALDAGFTLGQMAGGFTASPEFIKLYGTTPSKDQMILAAYNNVLHRAPEPSGYSFWMEQMNGGMTIETLLLYFSDSPENRAQVAPAIENGIEFIRR